MRIVRRVRADFVVSVLATFSAAACIEPFSGSQVQLDLGRSVHVNPRGSEVVEADQPPLDTHYELYAVDAVYRTNADGTTVLDATGQPVIDRSYLFKVIDFSIRPVIDMSSPCFIETADSRFPGLHVTQYASALRAATNIPDPFNANCAANDEECKGNVIDILTADQRMNNLPLLQSAVRAVTSFSNFRYPVIGTACVGEPGADAALVPPIRCTDTASNAQRLARCQALFDANPDWYEGSDKVFALPLSGQFIGAVDGMNPVNGVGLIGGASFFTEDNLVGLDGYLMNWQYDDLDHDGEPDFPGTLPMDQRSSTGYVYMEGTPRSFVRGVIKAPLRHPTNPRISATLAIFPNLGEDSVTF